MRVGLIDFGGRLANLALMKIASYHRAQGHRVVLGAVGDLTYVSCVFGRHRPAVAALLRERSDVVAGGPGWDPTVTLPPEIRSCRPDYGLYGIDYGIGRLTEGCPRDCPYCVVPRAEGRTVRTVGSIFDAANPRGHMVVLLDANILASPDWPDHFREIREWGGWVDFTQGFDIRMLTDLAAREIARLKTTSLAAWLRARKAGGRPRKGQVHFSWDRLENEPFVREGIRLLSRHMPPDRLTFYMLVGYDTAWEEDFYRFRVLRSLGVHPFVMLYEGAPAKLRHFARWVNRRIYKVCRWEEYRRYCEGQLALPERPEGPRQGLASAVEGI